MFYPASCEPYCDADERTPSDDAVQSVAEFQVASGMAWHSLILYVIGIHLIHKNENSYAKVI